MENINITENEIYGFIYCISFPNGKKYIGQTTKLVEERIKEHIIVSKTDAQYLLSKAIRKYGENSIEYKAIDNACNRDELNQLEIQHIISYNTHYLKGHGYNMTDGGEGVKGYIHTEESKIIMSNKSKEYFSNSSIRHAKSIEVKKYFENPENKKRLSDQIISYYNKNPEARENTSKRMTLYFSNPENRLKQSIKRKDYYDNNQDARDLVSINSKMYYSIPENRENMSNLKKEQHKNNPEMAKQHSDFMKEYYNNNQDARDLVSINSKMYYSIPENRENMSNLKKEQHKNNPEMAKQHSDFMKEYMNRPEVKEANSIRMKEYMNRPEVKEANSIRMKERGNTLEGKIRGQPKPFDVYNSNNEHIGTFDYVPFAIDFLIKNKDLKISGNYIRRVLSGERKHTKGYVFKYKNDL
jgi:hypothetical protein